jgi:hypothetical protein
MLGSHNTRAASFWAKPAAPGLEGNSRVLAARQAQGRGESTASSAGPRCQLSARRRPPELARPPAEEGAAVHCSETTPARLEQATDPVSEVGAAWAAALTAVRGGTAAAPTAGPAASLYCSRPPVPAGKRQASSGAWQSRDWSGSSISNAAARIDATADGADYSTPRPGVTTSPFHTVE